MNDVSGPDLTLQPLSPAAADAPVRAFTLSAERSCLVGRSSDADWVIPDPTVSRRHASFSKRGGSWFLTDLSSRHGSTVNGRRLDPALPIPVQPGDVIGFGLWRCRCRSETGRPGLTTPFATVQATDGSVSVIAPTQLSGVAQRGLDVLMELTGTLDAAGTREQVAAAVAGAVQRATGCRRVVVVEPDSETDLVLLASTTDDAPRVSRSLVEQASQHGMVQLVVDGSAPGQAQSIMELGIRSAICAPIMVEHAPIAFLMIDTRDAEGVVPQDAAAFCQSVSRLAGLAFGRLDAATMADRHRQLQADLEAARRAQELLSPPKHGRHGTVCYRFESIPGRIVAGDLFDIFPLGRNRTAFFLGDVSGKGVGAAMLMAACQSQLRTQLLSGADLATALKAVNADLYARTDPSKFVTLIAAVLDADTQTAQLADAGHGLAVLLPSPGTASRVVTTPGFPLGVVDAAEYEPVELAVSAGGGLLLFSDGAIEQPDPAGAQFGFERVLRAAEPVASPRDAVAALLGEVQRHASGPLADDLTAASVWFE